MRGERSKALELAEHFQKFSQEYGYSVETTVRAIAMHAAIFERINPALWEDAIQDARLGMSNAMPETEN